MGYYQHHVFCCENRREAGHVRGCCADKNATALREYFKQQVKEKGLAGAGKVRVNMSGCLDRCELGAVLVVYPQEVWYHVENESDIDEIIIEHLIGGNPVTRLQLREGQKRLYTETT
jgi:(2Fe-2S) ferredoxin